MWSEKLQQNLEFKIPVDTLAIYQRRDEIQHPYIEDLFGWANSVRKYPFGSEFGKSMIWATSFTDNSETPSDATKPAVIEPEHVVKLYSLGSEKFGDQFEKQILVDLARVGYDCERIVAEPVDFQIDGSMPLALIGKLPISLSIKERDLPGVTRQFEMSMGMYRCVALIINMNFSLFSGDSSSILIDDIGEGLDYERSTALIDLLIDRCGDGKIQLIMTSNDKFIMNEVDLSFWHIIDRHGNKVQILDYKNSSAAFEKFKFLGLSNFDFFANKAYLNTIQ